jgi:hypothetical protein
MRPHCSVMIPPVIGGDRTTAGPSISLKRARVRQFPVRLSDGAGGIASIVTAATGADR